MEYLSQGKGELEMVEKGFWLWVPAGTCIWMWRRFVGLYTVLRSGSGCGVKDALIREREPGKKQARTL